MNFGGRLLNKLILFLLNAQVFIAVQTYTYSLLPPRRLLSVEVLRNIVLLPQYFLLTYQAKHHLDITGKTFSLLPPEAVDLVTKPLWGICVRRQRLQEGLKETSLLTVLCRSPLPNPKPGCIV